MAGGPAGGVRRRIRFRRLEQTLLNSASTRSPCAAPIDPLPREEELPRVLVARRDAARLGWLMRLRENRNRTRAQTPPGLATRLAKKIHSRGTFTRVSRKKWELIARSRRGRRDAVGSHNIDIECPKKRPQLCKYMRAKTHKLSRPGRVILSASTLASDGIHRNLSQKPSLICKSKRARNRRWTVASLARPFLKLCTTVRLSTSATTCARVSLPGNSLQNTCNSSCRAYIS